MKHKHVATDQFKQSVSCSSISRFLIAPIDCKTELYHDEKHVCVFNIDL
jgi:hypothetical protein